MSNYELAVILFWCAACFVVGVIIGRVWYTEDRNWGHMRERHDHAACVRSVPRAYPKQ